MISSDVGFSSCLDTTLTANAISGSTECKMIHEIQQLVYIGKQFFSFSGWYVSWRSEFVIGVVTGLLESIPKFSIILLMTLFFDWLEQFHFLCCCFQILGNKIEAFLWFRTLFLRFVKIFQVVTYLLVQ